MPLDTQDFDTNGGIVDLGNGRMKAPVTGYYQVNASATALQPTANSDMLVGIYVNGTEHSAGVRNASGPTGNLSNGRTVSDVLQLNAADYVEVWIYTYNAATLDTATYNNFLSMFLLK